MNREIRKEILNYDINFVNSLGTLVKFKNIPDWTFFYDERSDGLHLVLKIDDDLCYDFNTKVFIIPPVSTWEFCLAFARFSVTPKAYDLMTKTSYKTSCYEINMNLPEHNILNRITEGEFFLCSFDDRKSYHLCFLDWNKGIFDLVDHKIRKIRELDANDCEESIYKFWNTYDDIILCDNVKIEVFLNDPQIKEEEE